FPQARMLAAILLPTGSATDEAARSPSAMTPPAGSTSAAEEGPLKYSAPDEWKPGQKSVMRVAAFEVTDDDRKVEVTVIPAGGNVLDNVNRWRQQVGLDNWSEDELQSASEELTIDGKPATYVALAGAEQTILAAILPGEPQSWFFKLMGD